MVQTNASRGYASHHTVVGGCLVVVLELVAGEDGGLAVLVAQDEDVCQFVSVVGRFPHQRCGTGVLEERKSEIRSRVNETYLLSRCRG